MIQDEKDSYASTLVEESTYDPDQARYKHDKRLAALEAEKYYWENDVLRRATLSKNDHCGGFVEFVVSKNAKIITVHVPIGKSDICCDFTQQWVTF